MTIEVMNATVGPAKADGSTWDGLPGSRVPPQIIAAVAAAIGASDPYAAAAFEIAKLANAGFKPPDVQGTSELFVAANPLGPPQRLTLVPDSYTPSWRPTARWQHVLLDDNVRLRVRLEDKDLINNDPIGDAEFNGPVLYAAMMSGRVFQAAAYRRGDEHAQFLFVGLSVMRE